MRSRVFLLIACLLMAGGLFLYLMHGEIFVTFLLDLVVGTISTTPADQLPPQDYSWGEKSWGVMNFEFSMASMGLLLLAAGQLILLPVLVPRSKGFVRIGVIVGTALVMIAGLFAIISSIGSMRVFGVLAQSAQADPEAFGEMLPLGAASWSRLLLVIGESILIGLALAAAVRGVTYSEKPATGRLVTAWLSGIMLVGCALVMGGVGFGPLTRVFPLSSSMDPVTIADLIGRALFSVLAGGFMLLISGLLGVVAGSLPGRKETGRGPSQVG